MHQDPVNQGTVSLFLNLAWFAEMACMTFGPSEVAETRDRARWLRQALQLEQFDGALGSPFYRMQEVISESCNFQFASLMRFARYYIDLSRSTEYRSS